MVNSKKMSKSSIAVIVLSILLVLSMILGLTGAWFTQEATGAEITKDFGKVEVTVDTDGYGFFRNSVELEKDDKLMPGDTVGAKIILTADAESDDVWVAYYISVKVDGVQKGTATLSSPAKLSTISGGVLNATLELDGEVYGNDYETKTVAISYEIRMVQVTNVATAEEAKAILEANESDGTWSYATGIKA
ncbi:MAG: hypothetical protein ACI4TZ_03955 [Christensenellales bacterium]